ncbi:DUF1707 domain-containing protein [Modestobacter sp. I12A-02628]|uniref:DUF1707 domain-containing protein n=1 Tax=Goekera deserti TaxID=2497753 RepID=A0A7K3WCJ0_9ACTN|nr:DUF1707 domain-containing protein [Goekera deserti]NDI49021.1 DUF1707 domain-containing protein [Goekera deserti]NEL54188.1 DUF1707 domain-containing protein [Goekera deserti]
MHTAVGEGRIDLDEFAQRVDAGCSSTTTAELPVHLADLPARGARVKIVGQVQTPALPATSVFGDIRVSGAAVPPARARTVFGDVRVDLRDLRTDADAVEVQVGSLAPGESPAAGWRCWSLATCAATP